MILLGNQSLVRVSTFKNKLKNTFSRNLFFSLYPPPFFFFYTFVSCLFFSFNFFFSTLRVYVCSTFFCMYLKYLLLLFRKCSIIFFVLFEIIIHCSRETVLYLHKPHGFFWPSRHFFNISLYLIICNTTRW